MKEMKQDAIHTNNTCRPVTWSEWHPHNCWYEGRKCHMCQHCSTCSVSLPAHRYFTCTLTIYTLQALYQNHIISCLHTSSILHDIPKLFFPAGLWYYTCCGNFSDCPFVENHLLKSYCISLCLPLYLILGRAFLSLLC